MESLGYRYNGDISNCCLVTYMLIFIIIKILIYNIFQLFRTEDIFVPKVHIRDYFLIFKGLLRVKQEGL